MPIRGDSENLNRRPRGCNRFTDRRTDRLPPNVWILLNGATRSAQRHAARATCQRKRASTLRINDEHFDGGAAEINREECAALRSHCAATARTALRLSADRRCGRC